MSKRRDVFPDHKPCSGSKAETSGQEGKGIFQTAQASILMPFGIKEGLIVYNAI